MDEMLTIELKFKIGEKEYVESVVARQEHLRSLYCRKTIVLNLLHALNKKTKNNVNICPNTAI